MATVTLEAYERAERDAVRQYLTLTMDHVPAIVG